MYSNSWNTPARLRPQDIDRLSEQFPKEKMAWVLQPVKDPSQVCHLWTARKVLRRLVDHEKLHARYIAKVVTLCEQGKG